MIGVRAFFAVAVLVLANGQSALGQQKLTWRGTLAELDNFDKIINLSDREVARQEFRKVLGSPEVRHEIVAIHAYTPSEVCESAALLRRIANNYGALVLTYEGTNTKELKGEWFNQLDSACALSPADSTFLYPVTSLAQGESMEQIEFDGVTGATDDHAGMIAKQLFLEVLNDADGEVSEILSAAADNAKESGSIKFVYTTAALPFAKKLAELLGHCRLDEDVSPPSEGTACYHYLSHSSAEKHRDFLNSPSSSVEDGDDSF